MRFRTVSALPLVILMAAGCANNGNLDIRPVGQQTSDSGQPISARIALAQGHLALGNVALSLEEFRRAEREGSGNVEALTGMAECYRLMGRFDLTRRYYEQALAIAPNKSSLYLALAAALDQDGQSGAAQSVRNEVMERGAGEVAPVAPTGSVPRLPSPVLNAPRPTTVTVMLPRAVEPPSPTGARLERLSSGEVALITDDRPFWIARRVASSRQSVTVQFEKRDRIVVLNAARVAGIAARTRDYLAARGFGAARIGDAPTTRAQTLIQFSSSARGRAQRLAAQFPFPARLEAREGPLTLIVGRDAAARRVDPTG